MYYTKCGNSLSWSPDGRGVCTTLLKPPPERNRKRKREVDFPKEKRKEKGQEMEIDGEEGGDKSKERRLNIQKGQNKNMGQSAEVIKLSKNSKNVNKIQLKRSTDKKKFKGGRKGGGKGENVRKIT